MSIWSEISAKKWVSLLLMAFFFLLVAAIAWLLAELFAFGPIALPLAVSFSLASTIGGYWYSDRIALAAAGARPAEKKEFPYYYNVVEGLAIAAGMPAPKAYVIEDEAINAFATGRNPQNAAIAVTTGALKKLKRLELEGVVAHEMAHVKNYDIRLQTIAAVLVACVVLLSDWILRGRYWMRGERKGGTALILVIGIALAVLAPLIAMLVRLAISRQREYLADANGALLTRYPEGLASALEKIRNDAARLRNANEATAHMYIANPFKGKMFANLFSTHPPIEERIQRLRAM